MNTKGKISIKENKTPDHCIYSHAFGRSICHSDRAKHHRDWNVPSLEHFVRRHHCHLGKRPHFCDCPGFLWAVWHGGAICQASGRVRLAGLIGFLLFSAWMTLVCGFSFVEAFIEPRLVTESPAFVASLMGMFTSIPSEIDLGILPTLWNISGFLYYPGTLAIWHRYIPCSRPATLGGRFTRARSRAGSRRWTGSA